MFNVEGKTFFVLMWTSCTAGRVDTHERQTMDPFQ